jgi:hypothetical protein
VKKANWRRRALLAFLGFLAILYIAFLSQWLHFTQLSLADIRRLEGCKTLAEARTALGRSPDYSAYWNDPYTGVHYWLVDGGSIWIISGDNGRIVSAEPHAESYFRSLYRYLANRFLH